MHTSNSRPVVDRETTVHIDERLLAEIITAATSVHRAGLKSYGLLLADPQDGRYPFTAEDVIFFDPGRNRRNDPDVRAAFEAQGEYFRTYEDAGFVADSAELLQVHRKIDESGLEVVAAFHSHRRQPANFSTIDFRLHNPAYPWHLVVSFQDPRQTVLAAFRVRKDLGEFGISAEDDNERSETSYAGSGVSPLQIVPGHDALVPEHRAATA
jgi:proteasome lid subunit RPN8/RPN11